MGSRRLGGHGKAMTRIPRLSKLGHLRQYAFSKHNDAMQFDRPMLATRMHRLPCAKADCTHARHKRSRSPTASMMVIMIMVVIMMMVVVVAMPALLVPRYLDCTSAGCQCPWPIILPTYDSIPIGTYYTLLTTYYILPSTYDLTLTTSLPTTYYLSSTLTCSLLPSTTYKYFLILLNFRPAAHCLLSTICYPDPHEFTFQIYVPDLRARPTRRT